MNSEITDVSVNGPELHPREGWLFYDGACSFCIALAERFGPLLARLHVATAPLQSPTARKALALTQDAPVNEMRVVLGDGRTAGGADAVLLIAQKTMWGWPLVILSFVPGVKSLLRFIYRQIAARRHCRSGACAIAAGPAPSAAKGCRHSFARIAGCWGPMVALVGAVLLIHAHLAAWVFMWALAAAVLMGFKWVTLLRGRSLAFATGHGTLRHSLAYLFLWPGMDPRPFLMRGISDGGRTAFKTSLRPTILKVVTGAALLLVAACPHTMPPLARGWLGMAGIVLFLHFGIFDLLAIAFQKRGIRVAPIMGQPLWTESLGEFWGRRWNTAFSQLTRDLLLQPFKRRLGITGAIMAIFLISGLLHELVISIPAGGGYGLPTAYFLLQGFAVLFERSAAGRSVGLGRSRLSARLFAIVMAGGPAFFLFHPPFIHNVILPMLSAIGSLLKAL